MSIPRRRIVITVGLFIVILAAGILLYLRSLQTAPVVIGSGEVTPEATSDLPTGEIAFISKRAGNWEIYAMNADGSQQHDRGQRAKGTHSSSS